ncbi:Sel1 repeat-containing protein [Candidatus Electrothrix aarhusensis]|uniref:Sel1 repeat-containing protein n=1 Tax=Candidatus Electrothrix aarhusensis TaxID=1859131 RepID=A0A3S3UDA0_9BACT|nr:Sel1 repeat-containing protein [Candidatus Electrothrix aarhusensis]
MCKKNIINRFALLAFILVSLAACVPVPPPPQQTMRIHNSSGVADRPLDYASHDPSTAVPDADPEGRIPALEALAQQDPRAAYDLGLRFFRGDGVRQDSYQAIKWMRDAAERGDLEAQKALGRFYLTGLEEMGPDPQEAEKWLKIAVSRGDKESEKLLKEASEVRKREIDYRRWRSYWHPRFYGYWHSGYPYRYHWRHGRWYY